MPKKLLLCALLSASSCRADTPQVKQLLESALADSEGAALTSTSPEYLRLSNAIEALAPSELESLLPTAIRCVKSTQPQAQQAGLVVLFSAGRTPASAALFDAYISDFDAILSQSDSPFAIPNRRNVLLAILEITRPSMSPKAIQLFFGHLQDKANTALETGSIAEALLHAAPANETLVRQVLSFAEGRSEHDVKYAVLLEIGLSKIQLPQALDFIHKQLVLLGHKNDGWDSRREAGRILSEYDTRPCRSTQCE
jgi:hypothetical protein